ncbi:MAG: hypothetical protein ACJ8CB_21665 [Ktedonobacteraceae bacterium]
MHEHVGNFSWATMEETDAAKIAMLVVQADQIVESQELDEKIYRHLPQAKEYKVEDGNHMDGLPF